ncbi:MAG: PLP-dependent aminotransferase family protein [Gammaproteobacteria bacterium]|nr:MAG: PLP-dependent aminotransferase family protein [Gammaproteobacteria bacterium]TLZ03290.1 MAG: PLP-dependent aminotransferase family protein [Gammaproteobacteria bacterium]TLZ37276.1 MAG: PLP-dependent aminotransferase family protein [Gammaproteobacteria bacterium]
MFELSRDSHQPLVDQICERVTQLVRDGQLPAGARLPSIRKLARQVGASPFTVVDAYDRLVARGLIEPHAGRGFFVTQRLLSAPLAAIEALPELGSDALELARQCLQQRGDVIAAGSGFLPESWLLEAGSAGVLTRLVRGRRTRPWLPCPAEGLGELREQIAARLLQHGIAAPAANIVTTYGASHAFDLLARILLSPGDAVLVEDPGYFVLFEQLRAHHVRLIPVPRHADGPDLAALEAAARAHRPRAFFMQTLVHNPTGSSADPAHCHRILSLAEQFGFALVEDDVYGDLYAGSAVRLAQIDALRHVIYVGSYTKLIGPALRVGFIAADAALIAQLVQRKVLSVLSGSTLLESYVSEVLDTGRYRRHVEHTRARLARLRRDTRAALASAGIEFEPAPGQGIFLWGRVPESAPVDELVRRARAHSILLARGSLFSAAQGCRQWLRFNVAHSNSPPLVQFLRESLRAA